MAAQRSSSGFRIFIAFLCTLAFFTYYSREATEPQLQMDNGGPNPIPGLSISLEQTKASPPTITVKVTNKNTEPVTILAYGSPLDGLALQLGLLSITPAGAAEPIEIAVVQVRRKWPPDMESLITIDAGQSQQQEIVLRDTVVEVEKLGGRAKVQLKGKWEAVWGKKRHDLSKEELESNKGAHSGVYKSDVLEIKTD